MLRKTWSKPKILLRVGINKNLFIMNSFKPNTKNLIVVMFAILFSIFVSAQKPKSSTMQSNKKSDIVKPPDINQIPESTQKCIDAIGCAIRSEILNSIKAPLILSQKYPLKVNLYHVTEGTMFIGLEKGLIVNGKVNMTSSVPKTASEPIKSDSLPNSHKPMIESENMLLVGDSQDFNSELKFHIERGEYDCKGAFIIEKIPMYFERGNIFYADNNNPGNFSEGSIFVYNSTRYINKHSKWMLDTITKNLSNKNNSIESITKPQSYKDAKLGIILDLNDSNIKGALVQEVTPNGPALSGGVKNGDIIIALNGKPISNSNEYMVYSRSLNRGQTISVDVIRKTKQEVLLIQL